MISRRSFLRRSPLATLLAARELSAFAQNGTRPGAWPGSTASSYLSASDVRARFGLGAESLAKTVEIRWPSSIVQSRLRLGVPALLLRQRSERLFFCLNSRFSVLHALPSARTARASPKLASLKFSTVEIRGGWHCMIAATQLAGAIEVEDPSGWES
jgi:hypothetical protein